MIALILVHDNSQHSRDVGVDACGYGSVRNSLLLLIYFVTSLNSRDFFLARLCC